jgi:hypothetical protein
VTFCLLPTSPCYPSSLISALIACLPVTIFCLQHHICPLLFESCPCPSTGLPQPCTQSRDAYRVMTPEGWVLSNKWAGWITTSKEFAPQWCKSHRTTCESVLLSIIILLPFIFTPSWPHFHTLMAHLHALVAPLSCAPCGSIFLRHPWPHLHASLVAPSLCIPCGPIFMHPSWPHHHVSPSWPIFMHPL